MSCTNWKYRWHTKWRRTRADQYSYSDTHCTLCEGPAGSSGSWILDLVSSTVSSLKSEVWSLKYVSHTYTTLPVDPRSEDTKIPWDVIPETIYNFSYSTKKIKIKSFKVCRNNPEESNHESHAQNRCTDRGDSRRVHCTAHSYRSAAEAFLFFWWFWSYTVLKQTSTWTRHQTVRILLNILTQSSKTEINKMDDSRRSIFCGKKDDSLIEYHRSPRSHFPTVSSSKITDGGLREIGGQSGSERRWGIEAGVPNNWVAVLSGQINSSRRRRHCHRW